MNINIVFRALLFVVIIPAFTSCSTNEFADGQMPTIGEEVSVQLIPKVDGVNIENILTRMGDESLDLIGVEISRSLINQDLYEPYLLGLFDDLQKAMNFMLFTDYKYLIRVTMIPNGKYKIYGAHWEEDNVLHHHYKDPFNMELTNELIQHTWWYKDGILNKSYCHGVELGDDESQSCGVYADVDRFYGELVDYIPSSNSTATLSLKRVSSRLIFNIKGLRSYIRADIGSTDFGYAHLFTYGDSDGNAIQNIKYLALKGERVIVDQPSYSEDAYSYTPSWMSNPINQAPVKITWYREDGSELILLDENVTLQAGKTKIFDFDLSFYYAPGPGIELPGEDDWD